MPFTVFLFNLMFRIPGQLFIESLALLLFLLSSVQYEKIFIGKIYRNENKIA